MIADIVSDDLEENTNKLEVLNLLVYVKTAWLSLRQLLRRPNLNPLNRGCQKLRYLPKFGGQIQEWNCII